MSGARKITWGAGLTAILTLAGFLAGSLLGVAVDAAFGWRPYHDVDLVSSTTVDGELRVIANFTKTECTIRRLNVVGGTGGTTDLLEYRDLDALTLDDDRDQGRQTLRIGIDLEGRVYDWIEIRTRHDCEGESVDRVFFRIE